MGGRRSVRPGLVASSVLGSVVGALFLAVAAAALAADPSAPPSGGGSAEPSVGPTGFGLEAWLDISLPPDIPAGQAITVGATMWDTSHHQFAEIGGLAMRFVPTDPKAESAQVKTETDWPGHLFARLVVPTGGAKGVDITFEASVCDAAGVCAAKDLPVVIGGIGPPPEASRADLVRATVEPLRDQIVAGRPFQLTIDVLPKADWDLDALRLPPRLVAIARAGPRGPDAATAELRARTPFDGTYRGTMIVPDPGDVMLSAAFPGSAGTGGQDETIETSPIRITVEESGSGADAASTPVPAETGPSPALLLGVAAIVLLCGFVVSRVFADL
jgi:hypothetical protein